MPIISYYDILGVRNNAAPEEIAAAYRKKIKQWHPDICRLPQAEERMREINEAAGTLLDPVRRNEYDISLARELSLFRRAMLWPWEDLAKGARTKAAAKKEPLSGQPGPRKASVRKGSGISDRTITFTAGFFAAGLVLLVLVFIGLSAITSTGVPAGDPPFSKIPSAVSSAGLLDSTQSEVERANQLFDAGDYEGALTVYDAVTARSPDLARADVWYNRGVAQNLLGRYSDASRSFDRVLALSPDDPRALAQKSRSLIGSGRYADAFGSSGQVSGGFSDAAWIWNDRAAMQNSNGEQLEAGAAPDTSRLVPSGRSGY